MTSGTPCQSSTTELIHLLIKTSTILYMILIYQNFSPRGFRQAALHPQEPTVYKLHPIFFLLSKQ